MSTAHQRVVILAALREGPLTTYEMRKKLDVMNPAQRICELRASGVRIETVRSRQTTEVGRATMMARYILIREDAA